jgi:23S rRNA (cytosine1962-C5)-methyltransferase
MQQKLITLHKGREQSVLRRHPWIFSRAIQSSTVDIVDGDIVTVTDHRGRIMGAGHFQHSSLSVRMLTFEETTIDDAFWQKRLSDAARCRSDLRILKEGYTDAFRLVHGEGDQLPGLIIDVYGATAVLQAHSIGMHLAKMDITQALLSLRDFQVRAVYCKSKEALPAEYAKNVEDDWLTAPIDHEIVIHEGGIRFAVDVVSGQKTGFFLDQRDNRDLVRKYSRDTSVLNCFSYSGGFSLYALNGGAKEVISVDSSAVALESLEKNLVLNEVSFGHQSVRENVLTYLTHSDQMFDIVIVDPPAFAKSLSKRHNAVQAYKRLNMMALSRVKKGGMLFTFSCSQVIDRPLFHNTIVAAAIETGRSGRVLHELSQGADHPVSVFHPEGHYLKGLALYMD